MTPELQTQSSVAKTAPQSAIAEYEAKWLEHTQYKMQSLCPAPEGTFGVYRNDDGTCFVVRIPLLAVCNAQVVRIPKGSKHMDAEWRPVREPFQVIEEVEHTEMGFEICAHTSNYAGSIYLPNATVETLRAAILEEYHSKWGDTTVPVK